MFNQSVISYTSLFLNYQFFFSGVLVEVALMLARGFSPLTAIGENGDRGRNVQEHAELEYLTQNDSATILRKKIPAVPVCAVLCYYCSYLG